MRKRIFLFIVLCISSFLINAQTVPIREAFFYNNSDIAMRVLDEELTINPTNQEALFFRAISRILNIIEKSPLAPEANELNNLSIFLDKFGISVTNSSINYYAATIPDPLLSNSPNGEDVQLFVENNFIPALTLSINDLNQISPSFSTIITSEEFQAYNIKVSDSMEIDFGDINLLKFVYSALGANLLAYLSYDVNVDIDQLASLNDVDTVNDLFTPYPSLLTIRKDKQHLLGQARSAVDFSISSYLKASEFIRNEQDPQNNDLVTINKEDFDAEKNYRIALLDIQKSLYARDVIHLAHSEFFLNLDQFFNTTFDIRSLLPLENTTNENFNSNDITTIRIFDSTFPDKTFNRVLPTVEYTSSDQILNLPVVDTEVGSYFARMVLTNQNPILFSLLDAVPVSNSNNSEAFYSFFEDILYIPIVDVILSPTESKRYSAVLKYTDKGFALIKLIELKSE